MSSEPINDLKDRITGAVASAVRSPETDATQGDIQPIANSVIQKIVPEIINATNNEAWYQSKVTWGVIISAISTIAKPFAGELFPADQTAMYAESLATLGQLAGFAITIYGRWVSRKPLGKVV